MYKRYVIERNFLGKLRTVEVCEGKTVEHAEHLAEFACELCNLSPATFGAVHYVSTEQV